MAVFINQISIYLENVRGSLMALTEFLGANSVNMMALSIADASGFGIVRCIVRSDELERVKLLLRENGYIAKSNRVVCVRLEHRPSALAEVLKVLESVGCSVEYAYSFCRSTKDDATILLRPSDVEAGARAMAEAGVCLVSQEEVDNY